MCVCVFNGEWAEICVAVCGYVFDRTITTFYSATWVAGAICVCSRRNPQTLRCSRLHYTYRKYLQIN